MNARLTWPELKRRFSAALPALARREPILALAHDGFRLTGALLDPRQDYQLIAQASSDAWQIAAAVDEIVMALGTPPLRAVLATPTVTPTLLDLPLEPGQARSAQDMLGLVRWELEPLHAEQVTLWTLGNVLVGRGKLTPEQRQALVAELGHRRGGAGTFAPARFGDLAVEWDWLVREDIEAALALQQQLVSLDEQVVCAWTPVGGEASAGGHGTHWLAAAMNLTVLGRWVAACERHGMRLEGVAPAHGVAAAGKPGLTGLVLEMHATAIAVSRYDAGRLLSYAQRAPGDGDPLAVALDLLHEQLLPDDHLILWLPASAQAGALETELQAATGRVLQPLSKSPRLAAAELAARRAGGEGMAVPLIPGSEPPPPLWQRAEMWGVAAALLLTVGMGGYELTALARQALLEGTARALHAKHAALSEAQNRLSQGQEAAKKADQARAEVDAEVLRLQSELDFYDRQLGQRHDFVLRSLSALVESVSAEVLVEEITESAWFEYDIVAWSLSQEAGYRFARELARNLVDWQMEVGEITVKSKNARFGAEGFEVRFPLRRQLHPEAGSPTTGAQAS